MGNGNAPIDSVQLNVVHGAIRITKRLMENTSTIKVNATMF